MVVYCVFFGGGVIPQKKSDVEPIDQGGTTGAVLMEEAAAS